MDEQKDRTLDMKWVVSRDSKWVCLSVHLLVNVLGQALENGMDGLMVHAMDRRKERQWESLLGSLTVCLWGDC